MLDDKHKELLRQAELRVSGMIKFSEELDKKAFNLLAFSVAIASALVFFIIKYHIESYEFIWAIGFALIVNIVSIFCLLQAIKPRPYKGVGIPLSEFDGDTRLEDIVLRSKKRYDARFNANRDLNNKKALWVLRGIYGLFAIPVLTPIFYLYLKVLFTS